MGSFEGLVFVINALIWLERLYFPYKAVAPDGNVVVFLLIIVFFLNLPLFSGVSWLFQGQGGSQGGPAL